MHQLRFTIRELMLVTVTIAILCGWVANIPALHDYGSTLRAFHEIEDRKRHQDAQQYVQAHTCDTSFVKEWWDQRAKWGEESEQLKKEIKELEAQLEAAKNMKSKATK